MNIQNIVEIQEFREKIINLRRLANIFYNIYPEGFKNCQYMLAEIISGEIYNFQLHFPERMSRKGIDGINIETNTKYQVKCTFLNEKGNVKAYFNKLQENTFDFFIGIIYKNNSGLEIDTIFKISAEDIFTELRDYGIVRNDGTLVLHKRINLIYNETNFNDVLPYLVSRYQDLETEFITSINQIT